MRTSRGTLRAIALGSTVLVATFAVAPRSVARADGEVAIALALGELAVLGASIGTTVGVSGCLADDQRPPAVLIVPHFVLAAVNLAVGGFFTWIGIRAEGGELASLVRTFALTFGILQLLDGLLMGVLGGFALAIDEEPVAAPAMLAPLVLRWP